MMEIKINQIISFAKKRNIELMGNCDIDASFSDVQPINIAKSSDISFCRFEGEKGVGFIKSTQASLIFIPRMLALDDFIKNEACKGGKIFAICDIPRLELAYLLSEFWIDNQNDEEDFIAHRFGGLVHARAKVAMTAKIMKGAVVGESVSVGENTIIQSGAVINNAIIGDYCAIGSNAVIGGTGFGFEKDPERNMTIEFPHIGRVLIGDNVRVGACTCIDRASIGETLISDNVKIDNLVHVAHNVKIGSGTKVVAMTIIGGSTQIGDNCWIAPAAAIRDWIQLGNDSIIGMGAVVTKSVPEGATVVGNPAKEIQITRRTYL